MTWEGAKAGVEGRYSREKEARLDTSGIDVLLSFSRIIAHYLVSSTKTSVEYEKSESYRHAGQQQARINK